MTVSVMTVSVSVVNECGECVSVSVANECDECGVCDESVMRVC